MLQRRVGNRLVATAIEVFRANFKTGADAVHCGDVADLLRDPGEAVSEFERKLAKSAPVDFLVAGPPCQGHSDLNNSSRRKDPRNQLYLKAVRAIELFEPQAILIENVPTSFMTNSRPRLRGRVEYVRDRQLAAAM